ncbi:MAG: UbiA family prenyltransferase [Acidobacteriota bacterium]
MAPASRVLVSSPAMPQESPATAQDTVCVDLDGTLVAADLFWEALLRLITERPALLLCLPLWAWRGRAYLKRQVATRIPIRADELPYRPEVVERLEAAHALGHRVVLATACDELYARQVSAHLGIFSATLASDGVVNLKGHAKADRLRREFGQGKFQYVGNDWADLPVWQAAGQVTAVSAPARLIRRVRGGWKDPAIVGTAPSRARALLRAMRFHQWAKNLLVFAPLVLSHRLLEREVLASGVVAFFAFGFCASSIYVINDLLDTPSDRLHPRKRSRPFAAGELSVPAGLALSAVLLVLAMSVALAGTSTGFVLVLVAYLGVTTAYSWRLKREPVLDVFVLATLYVLRILGGGEAGGIMISNWLLGFALFLFLSLAFVKRYTELVGQNGRMAGRGYAATDHAWMLSIGTTAGYMSVVILALYVNSAEVVPLYTSPRVLWLTCPVLLFWLTRMWFRAARLQVHDDPVLEALKDPPSYLCGFAALGILLVAL